MKGRVDPRSRIRKLDQVDLWEISIVTFPLLVGARVHAVKDAPGVHERLLRRHPRVSFARTRAEREWRAVAATTVALSGSGRSARDEYRRSGRISK